MIAYAVVVGFVCVAVAGIFVAGFIPDEEVVPWIFCIEEVPLQEGVIVADADLEFE